MNIHPNPYVGEHGVQIEVDIMYSDLYEVPPLSILPITPRLIACGNQLLDHLELNIKEWKLIEVRTGQVTPQFNGRRVRDYLAHQFSFEKIVH
jgi:hypothetical protein